MGINLKGYFLMSQAVGRIMSKQKDGGSIIHMSSVNGLAAEAQIAHYNVSKGGINMLTMSMALELARKRRMAERISQNNSYGKSRQAFRYSIGGIFPCI